MNESISILGIQTELVPMQRNTLRGLNADTLLRFSFFSSVFNRQPLCIIFPNNKEESIPPSKYKKITEQIEAVVNMPVAVLLKNSRIYIQRERLINQGVYFIVSDKYAFLPSIIVNARLKKKEKLEKLTPAAQYILLYYLLCEKVNNEFSIKELEAIVPYNYVAIARAVTNLEGCGLCQSDVNNTGTKQICFAETKQELWEKAQSYLSSPVKNVMYSDIRPKGNFSMSGVNALSHYSHLNPEKYETSAIWDRNFKREDGQYNEVEGLYKIEIWKYPTTIPYQEDGEIVDKLSLYLSMKDNPDSRIEKELEIMIEEMKW